MKYRLMFIDCDRTLLTDEGLVTERTRNAVRDVLGRGGKVVFASGRAPGGIENVVKVIGAEDLFDYFICFNGGLILRSRDKHVVSESYLTVDDAKFIADSIACNSNEYYVLMSDRLLCDGHNEHAIAEAKKNSMAVMQGDVRGLDAGEKIYKMVLAGEKARIDLMERKIPDALKRRYNVMRSEPNNLEFVSKHTSKGDALITLAKKLNIDIEETISFGDSDNDSSMIKVSGMGVAMGNASEDIKAIADIVTDSNNNDGLAKAIEHIISLD